MPHTTIRISNLRRLSFCNSQRLPRRVWLDGELIMWTGIGWIPVDADEADGTEPTVVED